MSFRTSDGLGLKGWYVPSRNGAAVISFPGRRGPQKPARLLARNGYGVLLFDRRGEGESDGDANSFGWGGDKDILAAAAFLRSRPDDGRNGEQINHRYSRAVRAPKGDWVIPEAAHTGGSTARPQEHERRVVGFFNQALLKRRSP